LYHTLRLKSHWKLHFASRNHTSACCVCWPFFFAFLGGEGDNYPMQHLHLFFTLITGRFYVNMFSAFSQILPWVCQNTMRLRSTDGETFITALNFSKSHSSKKRKFVFSLTMYESLQTNAYFVLRSEKW
jgi:hypothetical protein